MDLSVEDVVQGILSDEAHEIPSDTKKVEESDMKLPEWYDADKFKQGCRFFWDYSLSLTFSMFIGFIGLLSIPSILNVIVGSQRSNTPYTAYKRHLSTFQHTLSWFSDDLKPGTFAWRSLKIVRNRHLQAGKAAKLKNHGLVSQRDLSLTVVGFLGLSLVKPDKFHVTQLRKGDMEAYIHVWGVFGAMLGIEDRYNVCRKSVDETLQVCQMLIDMVYTPCIENVPEYFEHSVRVLAEGGSCFLPNADADFLIYWTKYILNAPGYIYTEEDRRIFQKKLMELQNETGDTGIDSMELLHRCELATPPTRCRLLYLKDYDTVADSPAYKNLPFKSKFNMALFYLSTCFYSTAFGRKLLNLYFKLLLLIAAYFPYKAMWRYGFKRAYVDMFQEDEKDKTPPKLNSEYYKKNEETWYQAWFSLLW
ncbi:uncharacterized protein LOC126978582 isoform X1 [Leptidea sinapis]|uniref:uncharacterized protein LOC126978582 isoform X1 n=2 Tax=Leptidea sinapis TaxID=189913 RepID=UPI0021323EAE|nr:uncharacterized protein LOC126978582 isoform X1 [Leptidea sinapis]